MGDAAVGIVASILLSTIAVGVIIAVGDYASTDDLPLWLQTAAEIPLWAGLLGAIAFAVSKGARLREDLRLAMRWTDIPLGLACGFLGQIAIVLIVLPLYKLLGIDTDEVGQTAEKLADRAVHAPDVALLLVLVVVGAPIVEELFYRGLVLRSMERRWGTAVAVVASSLLFGLLHFQPYDLPALALFGLLVAVLAVRTGRLGPGIFAHMAFTLTAVISLLSAR
jgi:membrane protease YdiL (CAAX protease family)